MHGKAKENKKNDLAKTILQTTDPRRCKQLVANLQTSAEWKNMEEQEMSNIVTEKFKDPTLRKKMIDTKNKKFVECTRDKRWGADATLRSPILKTKKWQGENLLGSILNKEKARILQEMETEDAREQDEQTVNGHVTIGCMSHVDFKKWSCRYVEFNGQWPFV